jgi:hypothetical protein
MKYPNLSFTDASIKVKWKLNVENLLEDILILLEIEGKEVRRLVLLKARC